MLVRVATALDELLLAEVAFVGGCTTGLWVTDDFSRQSIRYTDDVDLIVSVVGKSGWYKLRDRLIEAGFSEHPGDSLSCRMRLGELKVDFMPDDESVLGFTNRWYEAALQSAVHWELKDGVFARVVSPVYLVATKLEAYKGRGGNDLLRSRDIEDILTLIDGRPEFLDEVVVAPKAVIAYLSVELNIIQEHRDFAYAVQSAAGADQGREQLIKSRLQKICSLKRAMDS